MKMKIKETYQTLKVLGMIGLGMIAGCGSDNSPKPKDIPQNNQYEWCRREIRPSGEVDILYNQYELEIGAIQQVLMLQRFEEYKQGKKFQGEELRGLRLKIAEAMDANKDKRISCDEAEDYLDNFQKSMPGPVKDIPDERRDKVTEGK